jgi:alpha-L-arabinofuranosidase
MNKIKTSAIFFVIFSSLIFAGNTLSAEPANPFPVNIKVSEPSTPKNISPFIWGAGLDDHFTSTQSYFNVYSLSQLKNLGVKMIRFPGGCQADNYNYLNANFSYNLFGDPAKKAERTGLSVDQVLSIASTASAEVLYVLNVQKDLGAPDPCGWNTNNVGSAQDARNIVQKYTVEARNSGKKFITYYEMGNESWGGYPYAGYPFDRSLSDYEATAKLFAEAMKGVDNSIKISLQGYPSTGNNQAIDGKVSLTPDAKKWQDMVKRLLPLKCNGVPCFDFVTDHPYVYAGFNKVLGGSDASNFPGMSAYYPQINYKTIFENAKTDYPSAKLDITEWNLKCWGEDPYTGSASNKVVIINPSFTDKLTGWVYWQRHLGSGSVASDSGVISAGNPTAKLVLNKPEGRNVADYYDNQISQNVNILASSGLKVYLKVYSSSPKNVDLILQQTNDSIDPVTGAQEKGKHLAEMALGNVATNKWQTVMLDAVTGPRTTSMAIVLRNSRKPNQFANGDPEIITYFDDVAVAQSGPYGFAVPSRNTVESGMFVAESMMIMAKNDVHKSIYHYLAKGYNCGLISPDASLSSEGQGFSFTSVMAGGKLLDNTNDSPTKRIEKDPTCNNLGCFQVASDLPYLSAYSSLSVDKKLHVFLINRHETNSSTTSVDLASIPKITSGTNVTVSTWTSSGFTSPKFSLPASTTLSLSASKTISVTVPPVSMVRLEIPITTPPSDINKDDKVDISDFSIMVGSFDLKPYTIFDYNNLSENYQKLSGYAYGLNTDIPVVGNWAGGKKEFPAVVRGALWLEKNNYLSSYADKTVNTNFIPTGKTNYLACDWTGSGQKTPTIVSGGIWRVRSLNSDGDYTLTFAFGNPDDIPVCGNWKGRSDNRQSPGVFRNGTWYLSENLINPSVSTPQTILAPISYNFGQAGDIPLIGKWTSSKLDLPALYRPSTFTFYQKNSHDSGFANTSYIFGNLGDKPIAGDWAGTGKTSVGVVRNGKWYFKDL